MPGRKRDERGASALELSIIAPMLLGLIFMSVQAALWLYGRSVALNAAQEGVSQLRLIQPPVYNDGLGEQVRAETQAYAARLGGTALRNTRVPDLTYDDVAGQVSVTVAGDTVSLIPGVTLTVTRTATGPIEQFEADN
ncbi:TadE/TadG family type IV pilus assembly protein [Kribbella deserti]|uniref:TadE/TadG family type IV pilus assembly protein n=1 Tax=Kribbella deserti TaxID=1926257 RepID=A0ABV6QL00_9ACTN